MDEEMEYAEMLEIPVSTVNVTQKRGRKPKKQTDLKDKVITKVNEKSENEPQEIKASARKTASTGSKPKKSATIQNATAKNTTIQSATAKSAPTQSASAQDKIEQISIERKEDF